MARALIMGHVDSPHTVGHTRGCSQQPPGI
jgi:hypothetical protein